MNKFQFLYIAFFALIQLSLFAENPKILTNFSQIYCPPNGQGFIPTGQCSMIVDNLGLVLVDCPEPEDLMYSLSSATSGTGSGDVNGLVFNEGITVVVYTYTNPNNGMEESCTFSFFALDVETPEIECPENIVADADPGQCGTVITNIGAFGITDNCDVLPLTYSLNGANNGTGTLDASGIFFNVGATTVTYNETDIGGNMNNCSFTVTINESQNPMGDCPDNITLEIPEGMNNMTVNNISITNLSDNCGTPIVTYQLTDATIGNGNDDASGLVFNLGSTTVTYTITDLSENSIDCSFEILLVTAGLCEVDLGENQTLCPNETITLDAENTESTYEWSTGSIDQSITVNTTSTYSVTVTTNTGCIATDSVNLAFEDETNPVAICQNKTLLLDEFGSTLFPLATEFDDGSNDLCGNISYQINPQSFNCSNIGENLVVLVIIDEQGLVDTCHAIVTVIDPFAPTNVNCPESLIEEIIAPANSLELNFPIPAANDNCDDNFETTYTLNGATTGSGSGNIEESFNTGITNVTYFISDSNGNPSQCSFQVTINQLTATQNNNNTNSNILLSFNPNPANSFINLHLNCKENTLTSITIFNTMGKVINNQKDVCQENYKLDISSLAQGIYFVKVELKNGEYNLARFLKL